MALHVVTGGAGFIGSHLVAALAGRGDRVRVLDNFSTGKTENLEGLPRTVEVREVDLATGVLAPHLHGADTVFHEAANPSVPLSMDDPAATHDTNVNGTLKLLIAARDAGVRRLVCASSCAVYGDDPELPKRESMPAVPVSPYGAQKYISEVYAATFSRSFGLETVSLRYFNVFGPRQDPSSPYSGVFARFIPAVIRGERPVIYGDGTQSRDFLFVSDVVGANLRASVAGGVAGEVFNVAGGVASSVRAVLDEIVSLTGSTVEPVYEPRRYGDILHSRGDPRKAAEKFGWKASTSLGEGLRTTIDWYRENL